MPYIVAVLTLRSKKPQFFIFKTRKEASGFMRAAMKGSCRVALSKVIMPEKNAMRRV